MGDDEEVVLFALKLENNGLETDGKVVIGLYLLVEGSTLGSVGEDLPPHAGICGGMGHVRVCQPRRGKAL